MSLSWDSTRMVTEPDPEEYDFLKVARERLDLRTKNDCGCRHACVEQAFTRGYRACFVTIELAWMKAVRKYAEEVKPQEWVGDSHTSPASTCRGCCPEEVEDVGDGFNLQGAVRMEEQKTQELFNNPNVIKDAAGIRWVKREKIQPGGMLAVWWEPASGE